MNNQQPNTSQTSFSSSITKVQQDDNKGKDSDNNHNNQPQQGEGGPSATTYEDLHRYVYVSERVEPKPEAVAKPQSRFSKFMTKFQSPAVKATKAAHAREMLEQERTGVKKVQVFDSRMSSTSWAVAGAGGA